MGALGVPTLVRFPTRHGLPSTSIYIKKFSDPCRLPQSTAVSGTTPSGCTQRAPTCLDPTQHDLSRPSGSIVQETFDKDPRQIKHSMVVSGTTPSGCTQRAPTGLISHSVWPVRTEWRKKSLFSDHSRPLAVDYGLGHYTQWVHLACPHWFRFHSTWSVQVE